MKRILTLVLLLALLCACGVETPADPGGQNYPQQNQLVFDGADYYALDAGALLRLDAVPCGEDCFIPLAVGHAVDKRVIFAVNIVHKAVLAKRGFQQRPGRLLVAGSFGDPPTDGVVLAPACIFAQRDGN